MPKDKLNTKEEKILTDIYYSLGRDGSKADGILVAGITKDERERYLEFFVEGGFLSLSNGLYSSTPKGLVIFQKRRAFAEKSFCKRDF